MSPRSAYQRALSRFIPDRAALVALALVLALSACGGSDVVGPDAAITPLVGDWNATELVLTNSTNAGVTVDLVEQGATFSLNVQPSGQYTAILVFALQSQTEVGQIQVDGNQITLSPTVPAGQPSTSGTYSLTGDVLVVDGVTEFDFNRDGTPEPASVHFRLLRQ
jgi:hypothetical protein